MKPLIMYNFYWVIILLKEILKRVKPRNVEIEQFKEK